jgi:hypothetical protein
LFLFAPIYVLWSNIFLFISLQINHKLVCVVWCCHSEWWQWSCQQRARHLI